MAVAQEVLDTIVMVQGVLAASSANMDLVITKIQGLSQGGGATQQELDQIQAGVMGLFADATTVEQKIAQALAL